jgi:hypothetical protein
MVAHGSRADYQLIKGKALKMFSVIVGSPVGFGARRSPKSLRLGTEWGCVAIRG